MDDQRFDRLTRAFAATPSRRQLLKAALGAAGAAVLVAVRGQGAAACAGLDQACSKSNPCCAGRCAGRVCVCPQNTTRCGDACLDTRKDPANCGGCGQACPTGQVCRRGTCRCPAGTTLCGDACIDTTSDPANCGGCDEVCASSACSDAVCVRGRCKQRNRPAGTPCGDGNLCTQSATCNGNGTCVGGNPIDCTALDQCHDPGVCDPATGLCSNPAKPNGTPCDDGDACTQTDTCQTGVCTGADPVVCPTPDECHNPGVCDPGTGTCSAAQLTAGFCFIAGACVAAGSPHPDNPCQFCDPARSTSGWSALADGTRCSDDNACTDTDTCQAGVCAPGTSVVCPPPGVCRQTGVCNPATGECDDAVAPDGTPCDDGDPCTIGDLCQGGECIPGESRDCGESNGCNVVGCDSVTGACFALPVNDFTPCDNAGDLCTDDYCIGGVCTHPPKDCDDGDPCTIDSCDPATGFCVNDPIECDDGDDCTIDFCDEDGQCQHEPIEGCGEGCEEQVCENGAVWDPDACACVCPAETSQCQEVCTDMRSDPTNCGQCGRDCNANAGPCDQFDCVEGQCMPRQVPCGPGFCAGKQTCCIGESPFSGTCCCPDDTCCVGNIGSRCCKPFEICFTEGDLGNIAHCAS